MCCVHFAIILPIVISIIRLTKTLDCLQRQTSPQAKLYESSLPSLSYGHFWFSGALDGAKQTHKHVSHWLSKQSNYFQSCPVLWLPSQDLQRLAHLFIHLIGHDQIYHHLHNQLCIYHMTHKFDILKGILWEI